VAAELRRHAHEERARRDDGAFGDERAGGDDGTLADGAPFRMMEPMPMRHKFSMVQPCSVTLWPMVTSSPRMTVLLLHPVQHGAVLDIGAGADADVVDIAAQHGAEPDARVLADGDVADEVGARR
jgi:hypothetical protein